MSNRVPVGGEAVKSADRVLDLFELLSEWGHEISHNDIAAALNIPKGSLTKLLRNLMARGYIDFSPASKGYRLGEAFTRLAGQASQMRSLLALAKPLLREMTAHTLESSTLNQLKGYQSVVIATVSSPLRLVPHMRVGDVGPLYALSGGKCMLAAMPDAMIDDYLRSVAFEPITPKTIRSAAQLWQEIEHVRAHGFAFSLEEFTPGICGIGVAIKAQSGFPVGSLTLAIPTVRFNVDSKQRGISVLKIAAERLHRQAESYAFPKTRSEDAPAPDETSAVEQSQTEDGS